MSKLNELLVHKQESWSKYHDAIEKIEEQRRRLEKLYETQQAGISSELSKMTWVSVHYDAGVRDRVYHHQWYGGRSAHHHYGEKDWGGWQALKPQRHVELELISFSEKMTYAEAITRLEAEGWILEDVFALCAFRDKYFPGLRDKYLKDQEEAFRKSGHFSPGHVIAGNVEVEAAAMEVSYAGNSRETHYFPVINRVNISSTIRPNDKFLVSRREEDDNA